MEIFKVEGKNVSKAQVSQSGVPEETEGYVPSEAEELEKVKLATGELEAPVAGKGEEAGSSINFTDTGNKKGVSMIKIDGPLSQVFTKALNEILAVENMVMMPVLVEEYERMKEDPSFNDVTEIHVQAYDGNDLKLSDVTEITDEVTKYQDVQHVIAVERAHTVSKAVGMVSNLCHLVKAREATRIKRAAEMTFEMIRGV